jgi:hypothetical protein
MTLKPSLWRADHLYVQRFPWSRRPGVESCRGYFEPADLHPEDGEVTVDLDALQPKE